MFCHGPVGREDALDDGAQTISVKMFHWCIAPSQWITRFDLHLKEALNKPSILLPSGFVKVEPFHRCFKPARGMAKGFWQCPTGQIDDNCFLALTPRGLLVSHLELEIAGLAGKSDFGHALCAVAIDSLAVLEARRDPRVTGILEWPSHQTLLSGFCRRCSTRGESSRIACNERVLLSMATRRSTG